MRYSVIIPAAGSGSRMRADMPKVLLSWANSPTEQPRSILQRTLEPFLADHACERIIVCVPPEWEARFGEHIGGPSKVSLVHGGASRQESVRRGVEALYVAVKADGSETDSACVLVHDAARCCVSSDVVRRVVEGVAHFGAVTAAIPVPDSLSRVSEGVMTESVDRSNVWAIQTPQGFYLEELRSAHSAATVDNFVALDDASVVARFRPVRVVEGDRLNIKVTHPQDLKVAEEIVRVR